MMSMEQMYQAALRLPEPRLLNILRGQDDSLPQAVAGAALRMKKRAAQAGMAQQAMNQQPEPTQKDKLLAEYGGVAGLPAEFDMSGEEQQRGIASFAGGGQVQRYAGPDGSLVSSEDLPDILDALRYGYGKLRGAGEEFLRQRVEQHAQDVSDVNIPGPPSRYAGMRPDRSAQEKKASAAPVADTRPLTPEERAIFTGRGGVDARVSDRDSASSSISVPASPRRPTFAQLPQFQATREAPVATTDAQLEASRRGIATLMGAGPIKSVEENIAERLALEDKMGVNRDPYRKLQERLDREEASSKDRRSTSINEALLSAGLGMLGGRSQYAGVNIARGAQRGLDQFRGDRATEEKAATERARAMADIDKAKSDIARGDVSNGYAALNAAQKRLDDINVKAAELAGQRADARDRVAASVYGTGTQADVEQARSAATSVAEANRNLADMYRVDASTAAQLQAAGISASASKRAAEARTASDKRDRIIDIARQIVESSTEYAPTLKRNPEAYNTAVARAFARIWPLYNDPNAAVAAERGAPGDAPAYDPSKVKLKN